MNKLLYILLLSFFALSAIGGNKNWDCSEKFKHKKQQMEEKRQRKKDRNRGRRRWESLEQDQRQRLSSSNTSVSFKENEQKFKDLRDAGKYKEGLELTNKLIEKGDDIRPILGWKATFWLKKIMEGKSYTDKKEMAGILVFLNESIKKYPTMYLYSRRAHIYFLLRDHEQSLSDNEAAIKLGSNLLGGLLEAAQSAIFLVDANNKSDINSDQSKQLVEKAMRYIRRYLLEVGLSSPNLSQASYILARALHEKEEYQESIKNYDIAINKIPSKTTMDTKSTLYRSRAKAISDLADQTSDSSLAIDLYKEAIADCERAIGILNKSHPFLNTIFGLKKSITTRMNKLLGSS